MKCGRKIIAGWLGLLLAGVAGVALAQDSLELQRSRSEGIRQRAVKTYYPPNFDLSGLPDYKPGKPMSGVIRQWGSNYIADSQLQSSLEEGFRKHQPGITFKNKLESTFIGMAGLYTGQADLAAMGRRPSWEELQAYQRMHKGLPHEIAMATGSYDVSGWSFALVVFVHESNPVRQLTLEQLDGIFGAQREGGWDLNSWDPTAARGPEKNIRTWGQLGLAGEWADKPINVYGYTLNYHFPREFAEKVFKGGYRWNERLREYSNKARPPDPVTGKTGTLLNAGEQMVTSLVDDPYGITYTAILYDRPGVKPLPLAGQAADAFVAPSLQSVQDHSYPLSRHVYYYMNRAPGQQADPLVREYLRYVLSRQGQEAIQRDGKYLPLTAAMSHEQLRKLDEAASLSE